MDRSIRRPITAFGAVLMTAVALSACGSDDSIPGDSIAKIGDETIKKTDFDRWMKIAYISTQGQQAGAGAAKPQVPQPPEFTACVATKRKATPKPAKGQPAVTTASLKKQCKQEYDGLSDQVAQFLINYEWVAGEAKDRDLDVTDKAVDAEIAKTRKQSFPKDADFKKFLDSQGLTLEDIKFQVRLQQYQVKIRESIGKETAKITPAAISAYYKKNRSDFAKRETRDLRVIVAKSKASADAARSALASGQSWKTVAAKYSTDPNTKSTGGVVRALEKSAPGAAQTNGLDKGLDKAIFESAKGELVGPIKAQLGYYVVQVQKITAPKQQTEKEASTQIRQLLTAQNTTKAEEKFGKDFQKKWKDKTECQDAYKVPLCKGEKEPSTATAPAQQQQAPQQGGN